MEMDEMTMTQLTLFSLAMSYLWGLLLLTLSTTMILRRRRITRLEFEYIRQHPPLPYRTYARVSDTQEMTVIIPDSRPITRRLRHINPSDQVAIEIKPDSEQVVPLKNAPQTSLHKLYATLNRSNNE
jgi:hypothetical protein